MLFVILVNVMLFIFGLDFLFNGLYFIMVVGLVFRVSLMFIVGGVVVGCLVNFGGIWILFWVGRCKIIMVFMGFVGIFYGVVGVLGFWMGLGLVWVVGGFFIVIIVVCGLGCWLGVYVVMVEISFLCLRLLM